MPSPMTRAKSQIAPLSTSTMSYTECSIAVELKMTPEAYRQLPRKQRKELLLYFILKGEKEKFQYEESQKESAHTSEIHHSTPPSRFRT